MRTDVVVDKVDVVNGDEDATTEDQGVLRYCLRRRCSHNPRVGGGARVLKTLIPNPCVSRLYTYQLIRPRAHVRDNKLRYRQDEVVAEKSKTAGVGIMSRRGLAALREGPYAHRTPARATRVKNSR
jgi:hypothetical protein